MDKITDQIIEEHGLTQEEYQYILQILGREPNIVELGIFSVMWSEHASYKNSILQLKKLPNTGDMMLTLAGEENAGVVDIGENLAISFKIESHNHPSALEPYHGAATGVGGILRDIFTMGARPIAALNSLRFGNPELPHVKALLKGAVNGIADYGNCFGVPTVGGEIYFDDCYEGNPLVNAMAIGVLEHHQLAKSAAEGVGKAVIIAGAKTGRDGIHGTTFASVELTEESEEKRTAVQVGDPFYEKLLLEATLEVIHKGLVIGIQDMGAAGITCSTSEMSAKGEVGIEIDVSMVPQREKGMTTYEIMLSESQERMLIIVEPENIQNVIDIFAKWDLDAVQIGVTTDDQMLRIKYGERIEAEIPSDYLVLGGKAPVYKRETLRPGHLDELQSFDFSGMIHPEDMNEILHKLMSTPNIASKRNIFRQYDHMVGIGTVVEPGSDAAVLKLRNSNIAIATATDCNSRYCYLNPFEGTKAAVAESARNVACSGAKPLAVTNCLNFGNPYKPEVYYMFEQCIDGMSEACIALNTPVTGGNVSFYNESPGGAIYPTPVIGMLGKLDHYGKALTQSFKKAGDKVYLIGKPKPVFGGSEYLKVCHDLVAGMPPMIDLDAEKNTIACLLELNEQLLLNSAHDLSEGGLAVALAECCFTKNEILGFEGSFELGEDKVLAYFGETGASVVVSIDEANEKRFKKIVVKHNIDCSLLGEVAKPPYIKINDDINLNAEALREAYENVLSL